MKNALVQTKPNSSNSTAQANKKKRKLYRDFNDYPQPASSNNTKSTSATLTLKSITKNEMME